MNAYDKEKFQKICDDFIFEMEQISAIRCECARREMETVKLFFLEMNADKPTKVHPLFKKHEPEDYYEL